MDMSKKIGEATDQEIDNFVKDLKYSLFEKWAENLGTDEKAQAEELEIAERTGYKRGTPIHLMMTAFFAGVDAGAEFGASLMDQINKKEGK